MNLGSIERINPLKLWRGQSSWKQNLFLVCVAQTISSVGWTFMSPLYPLFIQEELGVSDAKEAAFWAGATSAVLALFMGISGPVWGYLSDRYGRKPILIRAYLGGCLVLLLSGFVTDISQLIGLRILHGTLSGSVGSAMALAAASVPRNRMPLAVGMMQFSSFFAITMGPLAGGLIANAVGFRTTYFIASGVVASSAFIILFLVHEAFERPPGTKVRGFSLISEMRDVITTRGVLPALMVVSVVQAAPVILQPVIPGFIQSITEGGSTITGSGLAFAVVGMMSGVSAVLIGRFSNRLDLRAVLILCCFGASLAFLPQFFVHDYVIFVVLLGVFGLFSGGMLTSINTMVGMLIPKEHLGAAFGVVSSANAVAWGLGPMIGGSLAWSIGLRRVFPAAAIMLALTGAMVAGVFKGIRAPVAARAQAKTPQESNPGSTA